MIYVHKDNRSGGALQDGGADVPEPGTRVGAGALIAGPPAELHLRPPVIDRIRKLHRTLGGLSLRDLWWIFRVLAVIAVFPLLKRVLSLPALVRLFDARPRKDALPDADAERLLLITRGLLRRTVRRDYCLPRSLILFHHFRKWNYPVQIHVGVRKKDGKLTGHAWVSVDGAPFVERDEPERTFTPFFVYPEVPA